MQFSYQKNKWHKSCVKQATKRALQTNPVTAPTTAAHHASISVTAVHREKRKWRKQVVKRERVVKKSFILRRFGY